MMHSFPREHLNEEPQALSLGNICMVDGSYSTTQLGFGWTAWGRFNLRRCET